MKEKKPLNVEIGKRIRTVRKNNHLTQDKLAEILGHSTQYISNLERGVKGASFSTIINLCQSLHVSSDYILLGTEDRGLSSLILELDSLDNQELAMVRRAVSLMLEAFRLQHTPKNEEAPDEEPQLRS